MSERGHVKSDPEKIKQVFASHAADVEAITKISTSMGAISHRFIQGDGEIVILDEWDTQDHLQEFLVAADDRPDDGRSRGRRTAGDRGVPGHRDGRRFLTTGPKRHKRHDVCQGRHYDSSAEGSPARAMRANPSTVAPVRIDTVN